MSAQSQVRDESSHSVRRHLRIAIDEYDVAIRRFIPGYEEMLAVAARELSAAGTGLILDLGAGTGALAEAILESAGDTIVELIDVDAEMLDQARTRLTRFGDRARFTRASFLEPLPRCNGAAASLALHHIPTMEAKQEVYRASTGRLNPAASSSTLTPRCPGTRRPGGDLARLGRPPGGPRHRRAARLQALRGVVGGGHLLPAGGRTVRGRVGRFRGGVHLERSRDHGHRRPQVAH